MFGKKLSLSNRISLPIVSLKPLSYWSSMTNSLWHPDFSYFIFCVCISSFSPDHSLLRKLSTLSQWTFLVVFLPPTVWLKLSSPSSGFHIRDLKVCFSALFSLLPDNLIYQLGLDWGWPSPPPIALSYPQSAGHLYPSVHLSCRDKDRFWHLKNSLHPKWI